MTWEPNAPFSIEDDVVLRRPGAGEVLVRIHAAGVCQTDISLSRGHFGQATPVILGHEGAGEVVEIGPEAGEIEVGQRVVLSWVPPCGRCYFCVRGQTFICSGRKRAGELEAGADLRVGDRPVRQGMGTATFAQHAVVPAAGVIPIPEDLPFEQAALLGCAVPTGVGAALNSARVQPGETVLVVGCGAVGLSAVQGAVIAGGSTVVAIDPQPGRRKRALELGAASAHAPEDHVAPPGGVGFDVAIDAVGRSATVRGAWDAVRRGGRVVVVGAGKADDLVSFSVLELFHEEKRLVGSFYGSSDMRFEVPRLVELWRSGRLDLTALVSDVVPLDRINEAVDRQLAADAVRVMVTP
ncbi:alcohol dehydrogenase catalytic domain-containing protein [Amycolatopsis acidiphila]|uniref:alcohol dehydrogenase catalytic domain-containing protein n=1 Tax=Amycolatopsis acidiphila TaxID=715473 RepID=UPI001F351BE7|nr:alcohol dehydrogenase catalytic domain-containing protein [Amycolatopsis acidiphila]UIJ57846.1 alcohol dehydrogenase catalytic domain-containing protein [Amycolatopsis acidiphila]